jgi:hypothetical protein
MNPSLFRSLALLLGTGIALVSGTARAAASDLPATAFKCDDPAVEFTVSAPDADGNVTVDWHNGGDPAEGFAAQWSADADGTPVLVLPFRPRLQTVTLHWATDTGTLTASDHFASWLFPMTCQAVPANAR